MGWLTDLLLESPLPPSLWLPAEGQRRAQARLVLERLRSRKPGPPSMSAHHMRDLGWAHPLASASRSVSAEDVEADFADSLIHVNPPIVQGWAAILGAVAFIVAILSLPGGTSAATSIRGVLVPAVAWAVPVVVVGWLQKTIQLDAAGTVRVRRWTDAWLRRRGTTLGPATRIRIALAGRTLTLSAMGGGAVGIDLRPWPPSARETLADDLHDWGVGVEPIARRRRRHHGGRWHPSGRAPGAPTTVPASEPASQEPADRPR